MGKSKRKRSYKKAAKPKQPEALRLDGIPVGTTGIVRGHVVYSQIVSALEGYGLERANQQAVDRGCYPTPGPYTTITIEDPQVICDHPYMEVFLKQKCYFSKVNNAERAVAKSRANAPIMPIPQPELALTPDMEYIW